MCLFGWVLRRTNTVNVILRHCSFIGGGRPHVDALPCIISAHERIQNSLPESQPTTMKTGDSDSVCQSDVMNNVLVGKYFKLGVTGDPIIPS